MVTRHHKLILGYLDDGRPISVVVSHKFWMRICRRRKHKINIKK